MFCAGGDPKAWQSQAAAMKGEMDMSKGDGTVGVRIPLRPASHEAIAAMDAMGIRAVKMGAFPAHAIDIGRCVGTKNLNMMVNLPQFTIGLINGSAMGGGVGWLCAMDYVIAVRRAYIVLSEVKIGVIPATISPYVVQKMGVSRSKRFFCCAENLTASRAKDYGIVDEVVDNMREGHEKVKAVVEKMCPLGPRGVEIAKIAVCGVWGASLGDALSRYTTRLQSRTVNSEEGRAGADALKSGTLPPWLVSTIQYETWPTVGVGLGGKVKKDDE